MGFDPSEIKHISLDVWGTMFSANKEYTESRIEFLNRKYRLNTKFVREAYLKTKQDLAEREKLMGVSATNNQVYLELTNNLHLDPKEKENIKVEFERLLIEHRPRIPDELLKLIWSMHRSGRTVSIASNTNFISGDLIAMYLSVMGFRCFKYQYYSDQHFYAKPHPRVFRTIMEEIGCLNPEEALHIGNDKVFDYDAAQSVGIHTLLVNNPDHLVQTLEQFI